MLTEYICTYHINNSDELSEPIKIEVSSLKEAALKCKAIIIISNTILQCIGILNSSHAEYSNVTPPSMNIN